MGIGGVSIWQLLIILAIIILLFGTKRLRTLGSDIGTALKQFRKATQADDTDEHQKTRKTDATKLSVEHSDKKQP